MNIKKKLRVIDTIPLSGEQSIRKKDRPSPFGSATNDQSVDFVELFFDLVFVFAITRTTHLVAHHLDFHNVSQTLLMFALVWWAWTQFTCTLNIADTKKVATRVVTLITTGVAFIMAASVDMAFSDGVFWFVVPYLLIRMIGLVLIAIGSNKEHLKDSNMIPTFITAMSSLVAILVGAFVKPELRQWLWLGAVMADLASGIIAGSGKGKKPISELRVGHFIERHALIVIIALGESLIVAGNSVAEDERTLYLLVAAGAAVIVTCLLWWTYFGWVREFLEDHLKKCPSEIQSKLATSGYSYFHFPLICGVISLSVAFGMILPHSATPLSISAALTMSIGIGLFVGSTAATVWRITNKFMWPRLLVLLATCLSLFFGINRTPAIGFGIVVIGIALIVVVDKLWVSKVLSPKK
ncbi:MAG: low temperature requirement protein A [Spirochaetaceae bacterium]